MRTRATIALALAAASLVACVRGSLPARELYRLRPATTPALSPTDSAGDGAGSSGPTTEPLVVEPYETSGIYGDPQIVYRVGDLRYGTYPNREWALPLGTMLAALTVETLRRESIVASVRDEAPSTSPNRLLWRGIVREFEEVNRGKNVYAAVRLEAALVRARDDSVLWRGDARVERPVIPPTSMTAVVDSLSSAATAVISDLARRASPHGSPTSAAARRSASRSR